MAREGEIRVGDRVRFRFVLDDVVGHVKEDRGPIGRGGRRLYSIMFEINPGDPSLIELPADEIEVLSHAGSGRP